MSKIVVLAGVIVFGFLITVVNSTEDNTLDAGQIVFNGTDQFYKLADAGNTSQRILLSSNNDYAWQFFPYNNNTQRLLVVLNTRFNTTVVWIANRDRPVSPNASLLLELPSRSLALRDGDGTLVWSPPGITNISTIVMNTTGNLYIVVGANSAFSWQSFDQASDVFVPGQRLRTNHNSTASLSWNNWASGHYTLRANPGGGVLYATFDAQQTMVPYQVFNYATNVTLAASLYSACNHTTILYNEDAKGVTLEQEGPISPQCLLENNNISTIHGFAFPNGIDGEGFRFVRVTPIGDIASFFLSASAGLQVDNELFRTFYGTYCKLPSYCGVNSLCGSAQNCTCPQLFEAVDPSDPTQGCRLQTPLNCSIYEQHQFLQIQGADYYANAYGTPRKLVQNPTDCTDLCLENCSCTTAFYNNETGACHLYDQARTMQYGGNPEVTAFLRVAYLPADEQAGGKDSIPRKVIIGVSVGVAVVVVVMAGLVGWIMSRRLPPDEDSDSEEQAFLEGLPGLPPRFSYKELQDATGGFSKRLGVGGSGAVYEGNLHISSSAVVAADHKNIVQNDSQQQQQQKIVKVAVKELTLSKYANIAAASKRHFRAEVATLGNLSHVNLVQLKGFCAEGMHRLLIYEFVENGSLDNWIFSNVAAATVLPWHVRYRIAVDTARGLAFLHEECREKVVHLDVKPQNILIDEGFRAKLADFGLSKLMERGHSETVTAMRGTPGYMAPEWFLNLPITDRSDVFSYGMVLLELVGGRKNVDAAAPESEERYFPAWALKQAGRGRIWEAVDKRLLAQLHSQNAVEASAELDQSSGALMKMERLMKVAFWCIQEDASSRPSMTTVVLMLDEHLQVPDPPLEMAYVPRVRHTNNNNNVNSSTSSPAARMISPGSFSNVTSILSPR